MKKMIAFVLTAVMLLSLAACTGNPAPTDGPGTAPTSDPAVETEPTVEAYASYDFTQYGKAKIDILGAEFIKDDYDEDVLRIYYNYTNTGDSACARYPGRTLYFKSITQDGNDIHVDYFGILDECAIPEDLNYSDVFDSLLKEYTAEYELIQVKTTNMGSLFRLTYNLTFKDVGREKELIDKLRCRNGNLEITISQQETVIGTL